MPLSAGTRLGPYEVLSALGAGGMGEVYRARDTKLNRQVAIKILLPSVVGDPEHLARFSREAQLLASLNHPNIGAIYGVEDADGVRALVMELIEGPTLADRIASGPLPFDEALPIARQIADALEAAHEQSIVHRDLKPANIKIREDGTVKVLDFGLAKALDPVGTMSSASMSPTLSIHATQAGVILGTAAYMSPEQARGRATDKRTDVWAFGCVLYEMLAGRRAFEGEDVTEIIASVVKSEPDWTRLPASVPEPVRQLVKRCLEKDRRARVSDIAVARFVMAGTLAPAVHAGADGASQERRARSRRRVFVVGTASLVASIIVTALITWRATRTVQPPPAQPVRFTFSPPSPLTLGLQGSYRHIALSPDGSRLVYQSQPLAAGPQLVLRPLDQLQLQPLDGIVGRAPFMSPDGRWIGYFTDSELRKVSVLGGPPITICKTLPAAPRGATWTVDNTIIFAVADSRTGLFSVPASGGDPAPLTTPDPGAQLNYPAYPFALPDGRSVLLTIASVRTEDSQIAVVDLKTKRLKTLVRGGTDAKYVNTGHIVFASGASRALRAARFDLARLEVLGDPVPVVEGVLVEGSGAANYDVSAQGTLAYVTGDVLDQRMSLRSLVWVNRQGREDPIDAPSRPYAIARLSPDGTRVALDVRDLNSDIWILDLRRRLLTALNVDAAFDLSPLWTLDGRRIIWSSSRGGGNPNLYWQAADGTGTPERLTTSGMAQFPTSVAADGSRVAFFGTGGSTLDISSVALPTSGPPSMKTDAIIAGGATKANPEFSPDGRWLAYESNEAGTTQVFVRPFPNVNDGRWQISLQGGTRPAWSRNGKELFYLDANDLLTSVAFQTAGTAVTPGRPTRILNARYYPGATTRGYSLRGYDVAADGQRFLMIKEAGPTSQAPAGVVIVVNWFEELKSRLPAK